MPDGPLRAGLAAMFDAYTAHGFHGANNLVPISILGRPPRPPDAFFAELAHDRYDGFGRTGSPDRDVSAPETDLENQQ